MIQDMGVAKWVVVHATEGAFGLDCTNGELVQMGSLVPVSYTHLDVYKRQEQEILPACKKFGLATLCYSPLEGGMLTGKYLGGTQAGYRLTGEELLDPKRQAQLHKVAQFKTIADRLGVSLANLAIAWLIHRGEDVIPILGASRPGQLDENIQALELTLDQEILQQIEAINPSPFFDFTLR